MSTTDADMDVGLKNYRHLLTVVAEHASLDQGKFLNEQRLVRDGACLQFEYLPHTNLCRIGMELGPMIEDLDSLKAMLESNAFPEEGLLPVMAFDPHSGRPMVFVHFPAVEDADLALRCFLDFGMRVFLGRWQEMWHDEPEKEKLRAGSMA